jgi:hypothetical protein
MFISVEVEPLRQMFSKFLGKLASESARGVTIDRTAIGSLLASQIFAIIPQG